MNQDPVADPADRPMMPPEPDSGMGALRWVITGIALVLLVVLAWRAYEWFSADVAKRRAVASGAAPAPQAPPDTQPPPLPGAPAGPVPRTVTPPAPMTPAAPAGPAVSGLEGVNKCVVDGQVTYTNAPCPPGAAPEPPTVSQPDTAGTDADSAPGAEGDAGAVRVPRPAAFGPTGHDPSQLTSMCAYWSAEMERLDFEFQQPLPPPVLDQVSTHLGKLREQFTQAKCGPLPKPRGDAAKPAGKTAPAKPARVVEERSGD